MLSETGLLYWGVTWHLQWNDPWWGPLL